MYPEHPVDVTTLLRGTQLALGENPSLFELGYAPPELVKTKQVFGSHFLIACPLYYDELMLIPDGLQAPEAWKKSMHEQKLYKEHGIGRRIARFLHLRI